MPGTPYARSSTYEPNRTLAGLILRQGEQSAQNWQNVGNTIGGSLRDIATQIRQAPIQKQEQEARTIELENARAAQTTRRQQTEDAGIMRSAQSSRLPPEQIKAQLQQLGRGDLVPIYEKSNTELEASRFQLQKLRTDAAAAEADYFGGLAAAIKRSKFDPLSVEWALSEAEADGHDVASLRETLKANPTQLQTIVDGLIERSPKYRALAREDVETQTKATAETRAGNQQAETARHNGALEAIQRNAALSTAERAERTAKETERHNRQIESIQRFSAETTRNRYTSSGLASEIAPEYLTALERSMFNVPAVRRPNVANLANRLWAEGKTDELKDVIRQSAIEFENVDTKNQVLGRRATLASLRDTRQILNELKAKGVDTGIVRGTVEDLARKLGKSTNPELVALANRLQGTLINYRRAATGVQFGEREGAEYAKMFPTYRNDIPVNLALIDGLEREMRTYDNEYWTHKLGKDGAALVGVMQDVNQGAPAPAGVSSTMAAKEGDTKPIPGFPGTEQTFKNGKWIRTK